MPDQSISEANWLINVSTISGTFQTKTGGDVTVDHTKDFDGGALSPDVSQGKPNVTDLTVGRTFKAPRDTTLRTQLKAILASGQRYPTTVTCRELNEQQVPMGSVETYECFLKAVNHQEVNANSSQASRLELVFTVVSVR